MKHTKGGNVSALKKLAVAAAIAAGFGTAVDVNAKATVAGRIKCEAVHAVTGEVRVLADWFNNLILDQGLNRIGTSDYFSACQVGTGNTAPANSDTGLVARVAGTTTLQASSIGANGGAPYYGFALRTFRFPLGAAAGNIAEVGIGWGTTGSTLFSRALVKDLGGTPTTITVAADEFLDVTYELRLYAPATDTVVGPVTISGTDYTFTVRASQVTSASVWAPTNTGITNFVSGAIFYNGAIGAITGLPSGVSGVASTITAQTYSNNSYQRDFAIFCDLNACNLSGGITALYFQATMGAYQASISPALAKTSTKLLTLNYRVSWARHV